MGPAHLHGEVARAATEQGDLPGQVRQRRPAVAGDVETVGELAVGIGHHGQRRGEVALEHLEVTDHGLVVDAGHLDDVDDRVADGARAGGQGALTGTRVVDGEVTGALVAGGHRHDHVGPVEVVDRLGQQEGAAAVVAGAAEAHVGNVHPVGVRLVEGVEDVLGARRTGLTGEDVVVARAAPEGRRRTGRRGSRPRR